MYMYMWLVGIYIHKHYKSLCVSATSTICSWYTLVVQEKGATAQGLCSGVVMN